MDKRRILPLKGGYNYRDLGGYTASDGRKVKWGKLFRTAKMSTLQPDDLTYLAGRHLATIVDFRSQVEVAAEPDFVPEHARDFHIPAEFYDETKSTVDFNDLAHSMQPKGLGKQTMLGVYGELLPPIILTKLIGNFSICCWKKSKPCPFTARRARIAREWRQFYFYLR